VFYFFRKETIEKFLEKKEKKEEAPVQFGVSVSKRSFKKAVHRNRIKRLIREAYRVEKPALLQAISVKNNTCLKLFIIYTGKELPDLFLIKEKVSIIIKRLEEEIQKPA
jgi:ribonuclease P protein component